MFVGYSQVGKSKLAASFIAKGYQVINDDICAIKMIDQKLYVFPGFPDIKLWQETLKKFNLPYEHLARIRKDVNKYYVPLSDWKSTSIPLLSVTKLNKGNKDFKIDKITNKWMKGAILLQNMYRCENPKWNNLFKIFCERKIDNVLNHISVYDVTRPEYGFRLNELTALVQENVFDKI